MLTSPWNGSLSMRADPQAGLSFLDLLSVHLLTFTGNASHCYESACAPSERVPTSSGACGMHGRPKSNACGSLRCTCRSAAHLKLHRPSTLWREMAFIFLHQSSRTFSFLHAGYYSIQMTQPQTLGYGLNDSPTGMQPPAAKNRPRWQRLPCQQSSALLLFSWKNESCIDMLLGPDHVLAKQMSKVQS